ncbi:hypothetical protein QTG56_20625 [Rossellomorea sp. AcN35-11]|nr:hypothetical protein [Rossellomorea aquimaris]NMH69616.1 hypothetical protein [Bacillus sp. RO3]WJV29327.1 hypothetical protein QTG56_20625 [Rossellomorea sp. AcN35-11]
MFTIEERAERGKNRSALSLATIHIMAGIVFARVVDYSILIIQPMTTIAPMTIKIVRTMKITSTYRINESYFVLLTG